MVSPSRFGAEVSRLRTSVFIGPGVMDAELRQAVAERAGRLATGEAVPAIAEELRPFSTTT